MKKLLNLLIANKGKGKSPVVNQDSGTLKISIDDVIYGDGWGFGAAQLRDALNNFSGDRIEIYLNSPGGDVFEARTMCSMLARESAHKVVYIDGLAASCASWLALSGDEVVMAQGTRMMVHRSWCLSIEGHGKAVTGDEMRSYVDAETWFSAEQALELGLIDRIEGKRSSNVANFDLSAFNNAPKEPEQPVPKTAEIDAQIAELVARNERHLRTLK